MGLSVLQKWMVEGRALGVSSTGVCRHKRDRLTRPPPRLIGWNRGRVLTRAWDVMTVGVRVLVADPGASKLLTAAFTFKPNRK